MFNLILKYTNTKIQALFTQLELIYCKIKDKNHQGNIARKCNCGCVHSAYILKPVLSEWNLITRIDALVFVISIREG